ncbi:hypothetical protein N7539_004219 [Penicillium diatomitis]|uniref:Uncharacterized protein n=1 Tax=Penicillium diatomitis TaxID=2819901 RepID=A0A9X0BYA4_9EURO|nr:uncharacterized protein N7539_004219 [Penicillium diatomitis]KAJ5489329.1 hypothetical protein N7539_004219 [Penicillium diatomitis]
MPPPTTPTVLLLGTCDTKLPELLYTKSQIETRSPCTVQIMDIGRNPIIPIDPNITFTPDIYSSHFTSRKRPTVEINSLNRSEYIDTLAFYASAFVADLFAEHKVHAVIGIGGSCGTALATQVMRDALPVGVPKLMVSTMASGDVGPYVGETDVTMMYSVVDIAGRNRLLERVLSNAAGAIAGMAKVYFEDVVVPETKATTAAQAQSQGRTVPDATKDSSTSSESTHQAEPQPQPQPQRHQPQPSTQTQETITDNNKNNNTSNPIRIGITMFGVTTPAATTARKRLESNLPSCEIYVFHATGSGGKAMERLIRESQLDAVLDLTTTEIADEVVGGVLSAGPSRLCAATKRNIPRVLSVGACDMVNFGTPDSIPPIFTAAGADAEGSGGAQQKRVFHRHNATVTLMRTTGEECARIAKVIATNLLEGNAGWEQDCRTKVILPLGGLSFLDTPGQPFWDPDADNALFATLEDELRASEIAIIRDERAINDPGFATAAADLLCELISQDQNTN